MGRDSRKNGEQGQQICADRPLQSDVVRLLRPTSHRTFIKKPAQTRVSLSREREKHVFSVGFGCIRAQQAQQSASNERWGGERKLCD